jgi:hypothetical protein
MVIRGCILITIRNRLVIGDNMAVTSLEIVVIREDNILVTDGNREKAIRYR